MSLVVGDTREQPDAVVLHDDTAAREDPKAPGNATDVTKVRTKP